MSEKCVHDWYCRMVDICSWQFFCIRCGEKLSLNNFADHASDLEKKANALHACIAELEAEIAKMKKYFHKPAHGTCCTCQKCGHTYDECRCDFDEALDDLDKANARIAELEAERRWIPVSEPPKVDGSYLLRTVFDEVYSSDFIAKTETWVLRDYDSVTHWMPLPKLPEVQE